MADMNQIMAEEQKRYTDLYNTQSGQRTTSADTEWSGILGGITAQYDNARSEIDRQKEAVPQQYRALYDNNALQEAIGRRQLRESMARAGLTDSGLNRTQNTALSLMRGNADMNASLQKQSALDNLSAQLSKMAADFASQKASEQARIYSAAASDNNSLYAQLMGQAGTAATSRYNIDVGAETDRYRADQAYKAAQEQSAAAQAKANQQAVLDNRVDAAIPQLMKSYGLAWDEAYALALATEGVALNSSQKNALYRAQEVLAANQKTQSASSKTSSAGTAWVPPQMQAAPWYQGAW